MNETFTFPESILSVWEAAKQAETEKNPYSGFEDVLKNAGWISKPYHIPFRENVTEMYFSPCGNFIVKMGLLSTAKIPPYAIPTMFHGGWQLQPKADLRKKKKAWEFFLPLSGGSDRPLSFFDMHLGNVGMWNNQFVVFDW